MGGYGSVWVSAIGIHFSQLRYIYLNKENILMELLNKYRNGMHYRRFKDLWLHVHVNDIITSTPGEKM